ncbi:regulator [Mycobacterium mantenii]|uniref:BTAD domain-containing putative transcriptional regulator n=1 Tax=Mycobacterium mantenii TaxID=560555 RepID=UPI0007FB8784|nr:BTAD domain-containing putative transcriptional regulator [Mycobacterium mantenii]OBH69288.1 regulator [Mycobacterium mantenii]
MELGVLGPLQVRQDGTPVAIPGAKPRAILTMLGLHGGSVVPADALVELLWGQDPPRTAAKALQTHISSLRRALGDGFVLTQGAGWAVADSDIDASRYQAAARLGRDAAAAGDTSQALARFDEALALWRGIPELPDGRRGTSEKTRWIEGHAALVEDRTDALLATGRAAEVIGDLEAAVAEAPLRERRWGQLMLALYRAGRQGEALGAYQRARSLLADELGVDPGPKLRRLEAAIVAQDASLDIAVAQHAPSVTRAVTFLLTDIEGSTAAWEAEAGAMAGALARHDELVEQVVTSRGGRLIKTRGEGDATFSVFDRPSAGAAAAIELQDAITHEPWALRDPIRVRMALHTGEVELRDGDYFGRAVNRVARLRSLAEGGQILCSGATAELVIDSLADDVMLTDLGMRQLKNLTRPEHVFELRLETIAGQSESQAFEAPMARPNFPAVLVGPGPFVGRGRELEGLLSAWQIALAGGVRTVLIAGEPGVGKTRLAGEWSQQAYAQGAVVLYGRCDEDLGAPYQPFAEALRSLAPCVGADRLRGLRGVEALLPLAPGLADALPDLSPPAHPDPDTERYALFDAVVALLEVASTSAPVVLILDDLHWAAKPTLLLLRHLLRFGDHARLQIVGTYRSTDLDRSHPLAAMLADLHRDGTANRLTLGGLDEDDVTAYVAEAGYDDEELAHALASVTGGNPFFLIEALRHVDESGGVWDQSTLPQGVREAVSRRLSRLPTETNKALAAAAVIGSRFALELVEQVVGSDLVDAFDEARQAGIVIEEPGGFYRFNHAIVRQSLLAELASVRRMRLHQHIAATLETMPGADDELLAELAHHYYECAWAGNAAKAVFYCRRAADQAMARLAYEGAADLYHHALHALEELDDELPDRDEQTADLLVARCEALLAAGDVTSAAGAVSQLQDATVDSARLAAWATCFDGQLSMLIHPERLDEVESALGAAAAKLAELDDAAGEAKAHTVRATCLARLGRIGDSEAALDDALTAARRAREHRRVNAVLAGAPLAALWGPNPVPRAGGRCLDVVRLLRITTDSPAVEATSTRCQAVLEAFRGRAAAARRMIDSARRTVTELGLRHALLEVEQFAGIVELIVDDAASAEPYLRRAYNGFRRMGLDADTAETAALLGRACLALGRDDEARELCTESERLAGHALKASIAWRTLRAHLLARGGDYEAARRVAEDAVALAERTDALVDHGDACHTLATVLGVAGDSSGARAAAERAVDLYERKGAAALAERARRILGEGGVPTAPAPPEKPVVDLENACVRVTERVIAAIHSEAWDALKELYAPEGLVESRRKIVGFTTDLAPADWAHQSRRAVEAANLRFNQVAIAVRGERLALARVVVGSNDASPGAPRDEFLSLCGIDESGRIALQLWFDVEDTDAAVAELDAAQARLEARRPDVRRVENRAASVFEHVWSHLATRDWDAMAQTVAENYVGIDHRRILSAETQHSRDRVIKDLQAAVDVGFTISMVSAIAIRGERLVLARVRAEGSDPDAARNDALNVVGIDDDDRIAVVVTYDLEDLDAAIAELDRRYLGGEAAPYAGTWSVVAGTFASVSRNEYPAVAPDCLSLDHRRSAAFAPGELDQYIRAGWDLDQSIRSYVEVVHRLSELGAVCTYSARGASHEGFDAEWRETALVTVKGDTVNRCELYDETDIAAAIARFDQLSRPEPRLENTASQVYGRVNAYFTARDWDAMANALAENMINDDRRHMVNSGIRRGRDVEIANGQAFVELGGEKITSSVAATRGARLALCRSTIVGHDRQSGEFRIEFLSVVEIDAGERLAAHVAFDLEDFDAAIAELDARYLAGEAAACSQMWSVVTQAIYALNRREILPTVPDWVNIDHRRGPSFAPGELPALLASWNLTHNLSSFVEAAHRLNSHGAVVSTVSHETSPEGLNAEWRAICVLMIDGDRICRSEFFDEADLDAALTRFDQLSRPAPRLGNAASQVVESFLANFAPRDWEAITAMMADDYLVDDRRRAVNAGVRHGRGAATEDFRAAANVGFTDATSTLIATRGTHLTLTRIRFSNRDQRPESFRIETLLVAEIDANRKLAEAVVFDPDDFDAAMTELDRRYVAGETATQAQTWSVISASYAAINRHEQPPTTADCINVDHRREIAMGPSDLMAYMNAGLDAGQDVTSYVATVHRLNGGGAVITYAAQETSRDGFDAEWRGVAVLAVDGAMVSRIELFDEEDLDAALTRFDQLSRPAPRLENAATRVFERLYAYVAAGDWDAVARITAEDVSVDDRRRVVNAGILHGRDANIKDARATVDVGFTMSMVGSLAIRGARLALTRVRVSGHDPDAIQNDALSIVEIDTEERIVADVVFDLDDLDAAIAELDARYLAGEAATYSQAWSLIANAYASLNRHELAATTPNFVSIDHRRVAAYAPGDLHSYIRAGWDLGQDIRTYIEAVHRLNDLGAVVTHSAHGRSQDGFDAEWRGVQIVTVEGDMISRSELFDEADIASALATFDQLSRPTPRLENAASRVAERLYACYGSREWDAMAGILAEDTVVDDRRHMVNFGHWRGRDVVVANHRAIAESGANITSTVIATRGSRLALLRGRNHDLQGQEFDVEFLTIVETDTDDHIATHIAFDLDDVDTAFTELETRYLAGEAAAYADTWSVIAGVHAMFNRHELPQEDWVTIDHRRGTPFAAGDMTSAIHTLFDLTPDFRVHIEIAHQINSFGAVITNYAHGSSPDGLEVEWRLVMLHIVDGDRLARCEVFDETDVDAALARFEELSQQAPRLENQASRAVEQFLAHFAARDWDAMADLIDEDFCSDDRRRGINAGMRRGRDIEMANWRATAEVWRSDVRAAVVAIRGERLTLFRFTFASQDSLPAAFQAAALSVVQVNEDNRCVATVVFDPDDFETAFEELEKRYLAGEGIAHRHTWSTLLRNFAAFNNHELPATTPGWVNLDHRRGRAFLPGDLVPYIHATWQLAPQAKIYVDAVHRLSNLGAVVTQRTHGTSPDGFDAEWLEVTLLTLDGDLINRCEVFDQADLDAALARFDELQPQARPLANAASRTLDRYLAYFRARDWTAIAEVLTDDSYVDDRHDVVNSGFWNGRDAVIANLRALADAAPVPATVTATRGEHLVLTRICSPNRNLHYGEFSSDMLILAEIDAEERIAAQLTFDVDNVDAAFDELETRYLAGDAAAHAHIWSLMVQTYAAFNRHEIPATTTDFVNIDHRRGITFEPGKIVPYVEATWDVAPDLKMCIETVHRLTNTGSVITHTARGTSHEGFDAEWRETVFFTFEGDLVKRCEMFDETDVEAALARFEELQPRPHHLENAASQVNERFWTCLETRNWAAMAEVLAKDVVSYDNRRVVNSGELRGRDVNLANLGAVAEVGFEGVVWTAHATRGQRLALSRIRSSAHGLEPGEISADMIGVVEVDGDDRMIVHSIFDADDVDAAFAELEGRYIAGEAATHARVWSLVAQGHAQFNRREPLAMTPDVVYIDHRRGVTIEGADLATTVRAVWDLLPQVHVHIESVHRLTKLGAVATQVVEGTSQEGFDAEWQTITIFAFEGDLLSRYEVFDGAERDAALARFDELQPHKRPLENAASRADDQFYAHVRLRNWAAMAEVLSDNCSVEDRRRVVNIGVWQGRDVLIANLRALSDAVADATSTAIAIRGQQLALTRVRAPNRDLRQGDFSVEMLGVIQLGTDHRIAAYVLFDVEDIESAFAELDARYLTGEAAAHAQTWSVIAQECAAFNRHELPSADWVTIDHRRLVTIDASDLLPNIRATWDLMPDISVHIEAVHRLSDFGAVVTYTARGTAQEGFVAEWRMIHLLMVEGDRINRSELFDEADLDAALARFDELSPPTPLVDNAGD